MSNYENHRSELRISGVPNARATQRLGVTMYCACQESGEERDRGEQVDCLYSWRPAAKEYYVGEPFTVEAQHPIGMEQTALEGKIASLKEQLAYLEAKNA